MARSAIATPPRFLKDLLGWLAVAAGFVVAARLGALLIVQPTELNNWMPIWFPAGVGFAAVYAWGPRVWPGIFLGALVTGLWAAVPPLVAALIGLGNVVEALVAVYLVRRLGGPLLLAHVRGVLAFAAAAVVGAALSASLGLAALLAGGLATSTAIGLMWWQWLFGNVAGVFVLAPLLLAWKRSPRVEKVNGAEAVLIVGLAVLSAQAMFGGWTASGALPLSFATVPLLVWAAFRLGLGGTAAVILTLTFIAAWNTAAGRGPFMHENGIASMLLLQTYVGITSFLGLMFAAVIGENERVRHLQQRTVRDLERRVDERTDALRAANRSLHTEMAERARAQRISSGHARVLELLATGRPLEDVLHRLCTETQAAAPGVLCSILLLDADGRRLHHAAAPSLPGFYRRAIDGIEIGPGVGSCGTAAATGARVVIADIASHPYWAGLRELTARAGLRACWSEPIKAQDGAVLGSFALYYRQPRGPEPFELELLGGAAHLAGIAIERKRDEQRLYQLANHDPLTGLLNRPAFLAGVDQALGAARRQGVRAALLFLDLDNFKLVNDTLGHEAGDQLLQEVARRLQAPLRSHDLVARLGGDEFTVLCELAHSGDGRAVADKLLDTLAPPLVLGGHEFAVKGSIGISVFPDDGTTAAELLKHADVAMYRAKEAGGDTAHYFTADMNARTQARLRIEHELRAALTREEFCLHFQPQWHLASGALVGLEALVRWNHPERGLVGPAEFIAAAEANGLIVPLGNWVLRAACAQVAAWRARGLPLVRLAVNLSPRQLLHEDVADVVARALHETGLPAQSLELELTETALMENVDESVAVLHALRAQGVQLAIDDFGTGYSSLAHLKRLPIGRLKIDRGFVRDLTTNPDDAAIVSATIALGHSLHRQVIAEGVESDEQLQFLKDAGCDEVQGYFLSRPLPATDIPALLVASRTRDKACS
ncbi:EAL domain-containing protein [Ectothiorhodospiraceae bacterium 2226]|nr:EAL domain-containing protein [Ectothiorhodospiraceae bacterium 2226]